MTQDVFKFLRINLHKPEGRGDLKSEPLEVFQGKELSPKGKWQGFIKNFLVLLCLFIICYLAQLELDIYSQLALGVIGVAVLLILMALPLSNRLEVRLIIFFIGAFLALRYMVWRTTSTLIYTGMADFVPMVLLYVAEVYSFIVFLCGLVINVFPLDRPKESAFKEPLPGVDILIPTYNEPVDVVKITATGCTLLDYPRDRFRVFVLDDGATNELLNSSDLSVRRKAEARKRELKKFCQELGIEYRSRQDNRGAKAGNINAALPACKGELLLILDCDHVPTRDFLRRTVGFFQRDEKLFLVQTPHFMINPNPVEKNLGLFADAPSESEMFYGVIQKGLDFWNSSFFCGSAALLRKKFLDKIGGISGVTVTEDAETSLELHSMGLRSLYFAEPVTSGLSPETFRDFINQRIRWAQGMIQILLLKTPLLKRGLRIYQKVGYTNSSLYWFFGIARTIFIISPLLYLFFGLHIYMASVPQVLAYAFPFLISSFYIANYMFGRFRWPLFSEFYETAQSIFMLPAVLSVLFNPHKPHFKVTPKGQSLAKDFVSPLGWPLVGLFLACVAGLPFAFYRWNVFPLERDVVVICGAWLVFQLLLLLMCIGSVFERHQWRRHPRTWAFGTVNLIHETKGVKVQGRVLDLSFGGMGAQVMDEDFPFEAGDRVQLLVSDSYGNEYAIDARVLRIRPRRDEGLRVAFEFICNDYEDLKKIVGYVYGDSLRWKKYQERKRKKVPLIKGALYLTRQGLIGAGYAFKEMGRTVTQAVYGAFINYWGTRSGTSVLTSQD